MDAVTLFNNAIDHWKENKGIGTAFIPRPLEDKAMILGILQKIYNKNSNVNTLIITSNFEERAIITEYLTTREDKENNEEFRKLLSEKYIKVFTSDYINNRRYDYDTYIVILYHPENLTDKILSILKSSKFKLAILNRLSLNSESILKLYSICPLLDDFKQNEIDTVRVSTPVEEVRIGVDIPEDSEDYKLLKFYNEYIETSINIFGSFDNIQCARIGNPQFNMSSTKFCYDLAIENGWSENLDMNIELNVKIDELFNPNSIRDRATKTYEMMRNRKTLLCNYKAKLKEILRIVDENPNKKILIISKFGEFAANITEYINTYFETDICGNYHDKVDQIPACGIDGRPIFIGSGPHKGERKMFGAKAQKTYNENRFNAGYINVLSTNNSPDKDLSIPIDIVIITSPECEDIESYIYRLSNITFINNCIKLYTIYVNNSIEEKKLQNKTLSDTHKLTENVKNENNFNFIVVD